ncbi:MAG: TlyA family RNA methyltransferase [Candidatus Hydrogenedentes bacterium]|nr:TlyA family RNA methyltransferase [Candidatus Hydrogenedentota bacterium]
MKSRLDTIVARLAGVTRTQAQALVRAGKVLSRNGDVLDKPGAQFDDAIELDIRDGSPYVSRGGEKLAAALDEFDLDPAGVVAIDIGASTGGFTDCLLQRGVARVYAVDVGYGQLAWKLRTDPRVVVMERTNIRNVTAADFADRPAFFAADCSFISLCLVLPPLALVLAPGARGVVLIKPQFEAGRGQVGKGGVVRDPAVHDAVIRKVIESARELGFTPGRVMPSPLLGPAGNREFLAELTYTN